MCSKPMPMPGKRGMPKMTSRRKSSQSRIARRILREASATRPQASVSFKTLLGSLHSPKAIREWIGLSLSDVARELDRLVYGSTKQGLINKQKVDRWERGSKVPPKVRHAYGVVIANELTDQFDRIIGITLKADSPWRVIAWVWCACGSLFELKRTDWKHCPKCR